MSKMRMLRTLLGVGVLSVALAGLAVPASAQIVQSVAFGAGAFWPRSLDTRAPGDALYEDLNQPQLLPGVTGSLEFDMRKFRAIRPFGEWNIGFGNHLELSVGAAYSNRKVASVYRDLVDSHGTDQTTDDTEIAQDLRLRMIPITVVVRVLGGRPGSFQPYLGGGVAVVNFRYSEVGDFVDTTTFDIFNDRFVATGTAMGAVALGGFRVPLGGDIFALTMEGRYQWAVGNTGGIDAGFLGDKIDLGGGSLNFGFLIRY